MEKDANETQKQESQRFDIMKIVLEGLGTEVTSEWVSEKWSEYDAIRASNNSGFKALVKTALTDILTDASEYHHEKACNKVFPGINNPPTRLSSVLASIVTILELGFMIGYRCCEQRTQNNTKEDDSAKRNSSK